MRIDYVKVVTDTDNSAEITGDTIADFLILNVTTNMCTRDKIVKAVGGIQWAKVFVSEDTCQEMFLKVVMPDDIEKLIDIKTALDQRNVQYVEIFYADSEHPQRIYMPIKGCKSEEFQEVALDEEKGELRISVASPVDII